MGDIRRDIRNTLLKKRLSLSNIEIYEKSKIIQEESIRKISSLKANTIALYYSINNEVLTDEILKHCLINNKIVTLPWVDINKGIINFFSIDGFQNLRIGTFNIPEPNPDKSRFIYPNDLDIILVPGISFDLNGNRLGYGKGFYDRTLLNKDVYTIGLAYDFQIIDHIPYRKGDIKVNMIISEKRIIHAKGGD
jgi:5-formyltetrahydrofolate cyclo-ligase